MKIGRVIELIKMQVLEFRVLSRPFWFDSIFLRTSRPHGDLRLLKDFFFWQKIRWWSAVSQLLCLVFLVLIKFLSSDRIGLGCWPEHSTRHSFETVKQFLSHSQLSFKRISLHYPSLITRYSWLIIKATIILTLAGGILSSHQTICCIRWISDIQSSTQNVDLLTYSM